MMGALSAGVLALVAFAGLGCNLEAGSSATSPAPPQGPKRVVALQAKGVAATATGQELSVLIDGVDEPCSSRSRERQPVLAAAPVWRRAVSRARIVRPPKHDALVA